MSISVLLPPIEDRNREGDGDGNGEQQGSVEQRREIKCSRCPHTNTGCSSSMTTGAVNGTLTLGAIATSF